jgi:dynein heavy chain
MLKPPSGVLLCMEVVCIMFDIKPVMKPDPNTPGKRIADYWDAAKGQLLNNDKKLLADLVGFDKENIS